MIFSVPEVALIRQGKMTACLVPASQEVRADRLRSVRRVVPIHDADGQLVGHRRERVEEVYPDGERRLLLITVQSVREVTVEEVGLPEARACGHRTTVALRQAWRAQHPRMPEAKLVRFCLGDVRDTPLFMNWTGRRGGDYTHDPRRAMDDAEALTPSQLRDLAALSRQEHLKRKADIEQRLAVRSLGERYAAILAAADQQTTRQEQRIVLQRLIRGERKMGLL